MEELIQELLTAAQDLKKVPKLDEDERDDVFESINDVISRIEEEEEENYALSTKFNEFMTDIIEEAEYYDPDSDSYKELVDSFIESIEEELE